MRSAGTVDHLCEPGTKRAAPLSLRNSSTIRMKPTIGHPSPSRLKSKWSACAFDRGRKVLASIVLSLNGWHNVHDKSLCRRPIPILTVTLTADFAAEQPLCRSGFKQAKSAKKLESRLDRDSQPGFEWTAPGCTSHLRNVSTWAANTFGWSSM